MACGVWLGTAAFLSSFTLRFSLFSLLYFSHSNSISQIGIGFWFWFWFWFDLERDLSDSLKASQCRVKHNLLCRIKEKERWLQSPSRWLQRKGQSENESERREKEEREERENDEIFLLK